MKKILCLVGVLFLMFGCMSNNQVIIDTSKNLKLFKVDLKINRIFYDEDKNIYIWEASFIDAYNENKVVNVYCTAGGVINPIIKELIESGLYKLKAVIVLDLKKENSDPTKYLIYPIWIYQDKSLKLDIIKISLSDEGLEI